MVFSEWSNETPSEPGVHTPKGVCSPMDKSRSEVGCHDAEEGVEDHGAPDRIVPRAEKIEEDQCEETYRHRNRDLFLESLL